HNKVNARLIIYDRSTPKPIACLKNRSEFTCPGMKNCISTFSRCASLLLDCRAINTAEVLTYRQEKSPEQGCLA
ncbi:hypothetical protein AVEN_184240-1, partial [Araneus ventricosus]